jgi:hypothetical protein
MSGSKPKLKVRTLDEMFKKISESSENDPEQLANTSGNVREWGFTILLSIGG